MYKTVDDKTEIKLPSEQSDLNDTVIEILFDKNVNSIQPLEIPKNRLAGLNGASIKIRISFQSKIFWPRFRNSTDKVRRSLSYTDGDWLGFEKSNLEASIDLGEEKQI